MKKVMSVFLISISMTSVCFAQDKIVNDGMGNTYTIHQNNEQQTTIIDDKGNSWVETDTAYGNTITPMQ